MNRRRFLSLVSTPVLVALLDACSSDGDGGDDVDVDDRGDGGVDGDRADQLGEARAEVAREPTTAADVGSLPDSFDRFGMDVYRVLAGATHRQRRRVAAQHRRRHVDGHRRRSRHHA